ncbi:hypothetical protein V6U81_26965, partial [Micromonospora sp. CPCC 205711]
MPPPRPRPRSWLARRLRAAADAVDRSTDAEAPADPPRRPGQPPEHWLRLVAAHAPGLLRDLDLPPADPGGFPPDPEPPGVRPERSAATAGHAGGRPPADPARPDDGSTEPDAATAAGGGRRRRSLRGGAARPGGAGWTGTPDSGARRADGGTSGNGRPAGDSPGRWWRRFDRAGSAAGSKQHVDGSTAKDDSVATRAQAAGADPDGPGGGSVPYRPWIRPAAPGGVPAGDGTRCAPTDAADDGHRTGAPYATRPGEGPGRLPGSGDGAGHRRAGAPVGGERP